MNKFLCKQNTIEGLLCNLRLEQSGYEIGNLAMKYSRCYVAYLNRDCSRNFYCHIPSKIKSQHTNLSEFCIRSKSAWIDFLTRMMDRLVVGLTSNQCSKYMQPLVRQCFLSSNSAKGQQAAFLLTGIRNFFLLLL